MLRSRVITRLSLIAAAMAVLVVCVAVVSFVRREAGRAQTPDTPPARFRVVWERAVLPPARLWLSPRGTAFCTLSRDGVLGVYSSDGRRRFAVRVPDATAAAVTDDGRYVLVYVERDPSRSVLRFLDSTGRECRKLEVAGAVWCADAWSDTDTATFVVGTGARYVYVVEIGPRRWRYRRWTAPGAVTSAAIHGNTRQVTFATWQRSAVCRATLRGLRRWRIEADPASIGSIEALGSFPGVLVRCTPNRPGVDGEFMLLDDAGNRLCRGTISRQDATKVLAAPNGRYVCLGQARLIRHKGKSVREKHTVLLDSGGRTLVDKGSLFFEADPLLVTAGGAVLVAGAKNTLFSMTRTGKLEVVAKMPSRIKRCVSSRDGKRALIECSGGRLVMLTLIR